MLESLQSVPPLAWVVVVVLAVIGAVWFFKHRAAAAPVAPQPAAPVPLGAPPRVLEAFDDDDDDEDYQGYPDEDEEYDEDPEEEFSEEEYDREAEEVAADEPQDEEYEPME